MRLAATVPSVSRTVTATPGQPCDNRSLRPMMLDSFAEVDPATDPVNNSDVLVFSGVLMSLIPATSTQPCKTATQYSLFSRPGSLTFAGFLTNGLGADTFIPALRICSGQTGVFCWASVRVKTAASK